MRAGRQANHESDREDLKRVEEGLRKAEVALAGGRKEEARETLRQLRADFPEEMEDDRVRAVMDRLEGAAK